MEERTVSLYKVQFILFVILLMALFFRLFNLGGESLWVDEGFSIRVAHVNLPQIIEICASDAHPPLYFVILHYWISLFGDSEFSTRFLSVVFGLLAVPAVYKVGDLIFNKVVGFLSALLLGLSVFHIYYSQEVRGYSLMAFLTLLSMYFFIKLFKKKNLVVLTGYILSTIFLMYTHNFAIFVIIAQGVYLVTLFLTSRKGGSLNFKAWMVLQVILVILFTPWVGIALNQLLKIQNGYWIPTPSIKSLVGTFGEYSGSYSLLGIFLILSPFSVITYEKIGGSIDWKSFFKSIESYSWNIHLSNIHGVYLLLVWLLIPIILPFVISQFLTPIYITRVTISASLAVYLLVAKGIRNIGHRYVELIIISVVVILSLSSIWGEHYAKINKEQWRDAVNYVDTNAEQGALLLFNAGFVQENVFDYYSRRTDLIKKPFPGKTRDPFYLLTTSKDDIKELWPTVEGHNRVWVILSHSRDRNRLITKALREVYDLIYYKKYNGIEVYLFRE